MQLYHCYWTDFLRKSLFGRVELRLGSHWLQYQRQSLAFRKLTVYRYGVWMLKLHLSIDLFNAPFRGLGFPDTGHRITPRCVAHFIYNITHYNDGAKSVIVLEFPLKQWVTGLFNGIIKYSDRCSVSARTQMYLLNTLPQPVHDSPSLPIFQSRL